MAGETTGDGEMTADEMLMRYADGELNALARARVERALADDPALAARLDDHRRLRERIAAHYEPVLAEEVPSRLTELLAGNVVDLESVRPRVNRRRWTPVAIAASLAAGVFAGQLLPRGGSVTPVGPVSFEGGAMIARGEVAHALETQLASAQAADAPVRIGVSFPGEGGAACRTFDASDISGVACRRDERWQVLVTAPGASARPAGRYAQAGSADVVVMQAAQDMMTGEPLGAIAERRARDAGWTGTFGGPDVGPDLRRP